MRYLKALGLAAIAAAALMAWVGAGTASATTVDCEGTACALNAVIHAEAEGTVTLHPPIGDIECKKSTVEGKLENLGSSTTTAGGKIGTLNFSECNATVNVLKTGSLEIHTEYETKIDNPGTKEEVKTVIQKENSTNNGTLTSSGAEVTVVFAGFHCIFSTSSTDIGTLTGSANTGGNATLDIIATIPRTGGNSGAFCGSTAQWTGSYKVDNPTSLNVT